MRPRRGSLSAYSKAFSLLLLACTATTLARAKESPWVEVRSPNFTVVSNSGEKEARRIADQFEQFREVFHVYIPSLRLDLGKPLIIFAVKNEDSLKVLLPSFWEVKGRVHPAGLYLPGEEVHLVAVRTDLGGGGGYLESNPYEIVYHEYTHAIMDLNFQGLPIWLGEGLAELFGNSRILDKEVEVGRPARYHLQALQESQLIPIEDLLTAGPDSPFYNEQNRVSVFYAESWAIVHYLMMDPEATKNKLLDNFLSAWTATGDQVQAAKTAFGDLKKFSQVVQAYARQEHFYFRRAQASVRGDPKSYSSRELPPSEVAANRAFVYVHTQRFTEASAAVEEALHDDPNLALAYEAKGLLAYTQQNYAGAETAFSRAIELHSSSYFAYFFDAEARYRRGMVPRSDTSEVVAELQKAISLNPQFAPAYSLLATVYSLQPETRDKAIDAGMKSVKLEPGNVRHAVNLGFVLLNCGKTDAAKILAERIRQVAKTPEERSGLESLTTAIESRASYDKQVAAAERHRLQAQQAPTEQPPPAVEPETPTVASKHEGEDEYAIEGTIAAVDCNSTSEGKLTLTVSHGVMRFVYPELKAVRLTDRLKDITDSAPACSTWLGKHVRVYFYKLKNKSYAGELDTIQFF